MTAPIPRRDRALVRLAPPSWRARYEPEFVALLEDTPATVRRTVDVTRLVTRSWAAPPAHLFTDAAARLRASLATLVWAWTALVGAELIVAQLREDPARATTDRHYAGATALYRLYELAAVAGVLVLLAGCAPLAGQLLRATRRARRTDLTLLMTSPVFAVLGFAVVLISVVTLAPRSRVPGVGVGAWVLAIIAAGIAAGISCAAGPTRVLLSLRTGGRPLRVAALTACIGASSCSVAGVAAVGYLAVLALGSAPLGVASAAVLVPFALWILGATAVVLVTSARGARALLTGAG